MTFHATIQLTEEIRHALQAETLTFNRGQWVQWPDGAKGRFIGNRGGIITILWRYRAESFAHFNARFARSCQGHKVSRPARSLPQADTATPAPNLQQQDAFLSEFDKLPYEVTCELAEEMRDNPEEFEGARVAGAPITWYQVLMQSSSAFLLLDEVTRRKLLVTREEAKSRGLWMYESSNYTRYPSGWSAPSCLH